MRALLLAVALALLSCGGDPSQPEPGAQGPLRYAALGDSTAFGVGAIPGEGGYPPRLARRLREAGRQVELTNLGFPGFTAADVAERSLGALASLRPDLVTIGIGANDVEVGRAPADFAAAFDRICEAARATGAAVVAVNVVDLSLVPRKAAEAPAYYELNRALNAEIARVAALRGVVLVDLYGESQRRIAGHLEYFYVDGFHPSPAGYEVWADIMWPAVQAAAAGR